MESNAVFSIIELDSFISIALDLAEEAKRDGNHPFGALLVDTMSHEIILKAKNTVITSNNPIRHAELNLVELAVKELTKEQLQTVALFTSTEPCPMCCGAIYWSGIRQVVYSCPAVALGRIAGDSFCGPCADIFDRALLIESVTSDSNNTNNNETTTVNTPHHQSSLKTTVIGPIMESRGISIHQHFWT